MDPIVLEALKKWPNVPDCRGWLGLDTRGHWYLRDGAVQAAGTFAQSKGSRIEHERLVEFIGRNYEADAAGCWFFQNGPQRVYVELEAAPWIWRVARSGDGFTLHSHTGQPASAEQAWSDEDGRLFVQTTLGFGLVHSLDMAIAADAIEAGRWPLAQLRFGQMPQRFGYVLSPLAAQSIAPTKEKG